MRPTIISYFLTLLLLGLIIVTPSKMAGQSKAKRYQPFKSFESVPGQPYDKFSTRDRFGREIIFYL